MQSDCTIHFLPTNKVTLITTMAQISAVYGQPRSSENDKSTNSYVVQKELFIEMDVLTDGEKAPPVHLQNQVCQHKPDHIASQDSCGPGGREQQGLLMDPQADGHN